MAAIDDVWEHAQHVRMWLQTAHDAIARAPNKGVAGFVMAIFTRGQSRYAGAEDAIDAIAKARLPYLDLENALQRAQHAPVPLMTFELDRRALSGGHIRITTDLMAQLRAALINDLAALDAVAEEVERLQKQARTPALR
jgi:hypothetical protein